MKNYQKICIILFLIFVVSVVFSSGYLLAASTLGIPVISSEGNFHLSEEQKKQVKEMIKDLKDSGATREEIRAALKEFFEENNLEFAGRFNRHGLGKALLQFEDKLTESQRAEIRSKVNEFREQNMEPEEIRYKIRELLQSYRMDLSDKMEFDPHVGSRLKRKAFLNQQLSEDQRQELMSKIKSLRESNASREETRMAIKELLEGYGIEIPEGGCRGTPNFRPLVWSKKLDTEQKKALQEKIKTLKDEGKSPKEIHEAIREELKQYGIELPEDFRGRKMGGKGRLMGLISKQLTSEQRKELREKTQALKEQGLSGEEIHTHVKKMLQDYGVEMPESMNKITPEQRESIKQTVKELQNQGATRQEIRQTIREMRKSFLSELNEDLPLDETGDLKEYNSGGIVASNYPNPFNPETTIQFTLDNPERVQLRIYNVQGQLIRTILNESLASGNHAVKWDGKDLFGNTVPSGIYFFQLKTSSASLTQRMFMAK